MRKLVLLLAVAGGLLMLAPPSARAGVVDDLLAVLGLTPAASPSPSGPNTDFQNCDTGECE